MGKWNDRFMREIVRKCIERKEIDSQCDHIWRNFATFATIKKSWAIFGRIIGRSSEKF